MIGTTVYGTHGSEDGLLALPRGYRGDSSRTGVAFCHFLGDTGVGAAFPTWPFHGVFDSDYPLIAMNNAGVSTFGNDAAAASVTNMLTQLEAIGARTPIVLIGVSMGALTLLNAITLGYIIASEIAAILLVVPLLYLRQIHAGNRDSLGPLIETAYGGLTAFNAAMPVHDPSANTGAFAGIPMHLFLGGADTIALQSEGQQFAANVGSSASVTVVPGTDHAATVAAISADQLMTVLNPYL